MFFCIFSVPSIPCPLKPCMKNRRKLFLTQSPVGSVSRRKSPACDNRTPDRGLIHNPYAAEWKGARLFRGIFTEHTKMPCCGKTSPLCFPNGEASATAFLSVQSYHKLIRLSTRSRPSVPVVAGKSFTQAAESLPQGKSNTTGAIRPRFWGRTAPVSLAKNLPEEIYFTASSL